MNKYDKVYDIRRAEWDDIGDLMQFIGTYWKKDHILAKSRRIFEYEYTDGTNVNVYLARRKDSGEIEGFMGFIPCSVDNENKDIWTAMWKALPNKNVPFLGVEIYKRLMKEQGARTYIGVGDNPETTIPLCQKLLHQFTDRLTQYYILNDLDEYKIAIVNFKPEYIRKKDAAALIRLNDIESVLNVYSFENNRNQIPYVDSWYVNRRFFQHPVFEYEVYGISTEMESDICDALFVLRRYSANGRQAIRIVKYIGNQQAISRVPEALRNLMTEDTEYIDFYCYGFEESFLKQCGFEKIESSDNEIVIEDGKGDNIIPNWTQPLYQKNINIWFNSTRKDIVICKSDGDQDRPAVLPEGFRL